ncbi:MAG: vancomycin high temperature exclusion protein [Anaerolineae bacterium]
MRDTLRVGLVAVLLMTTAPLALRAYSALRYHWQTYSPEEVPPRRAALIFGARVYPSGRPSAMLADRVATGADLYHAGKVEMLIMTGDGRTADYNEPEAMRRYAIELGVPAEAIVLDYAGLRTYDSCYRAREVFGVTDAIAVTQNFHLDRVLMTCDSLGIDVVGVAADYQRPWGYSRYSLTYSRLREIPATVGAVLDLLTRTLPARETLSLTP